MYLTKRDKSILKFIEEYGSITINQCSKIFFDKNKEGYQQARKRLKKLSENKFLKRYRKDMHSECIYFLDKKLSLHDLKAFDIYAELIFTGATIKKFIPKYRIKTLNSKKTYRELDVLAEFIYKDYFYTLIIEIDYTHFTNKEKLLDIYNSNHFQSKYKHLDSNIFPSILILRPYIPERKINDERMHIYYTSFEHPNIHDIL
ncbi:hypothetical protein G8S49_11355 [Clostridium botulinum C]|uniref:Replication-relaxation family protein n=2 Tax=Clostridium botulinum TaxID=1491 RepID=A0A9Q4XW45_CLOBO|nr:hypothetical protein [Clostridium botulinum]EGO86294.1 hypothetical protein CBCST_22895 [Clostridium botulinum C str. Stockholm]MCD3195750.1 hypothetical protein [Clostridium botulinum C]MCD3201166.1 hypothetical protein [Clostridium botulinum C]MCD3206664.1 hypothetical protein [Clostridium botulinum C]MCD3209337.1 hypothetical protein [Clostridium botulinum C]